MRLLGDERAVGDVVRHALATRWGRAAASVLLVATAGATTLAATGGLDPVTVDLPRVEAGEPAELGQVELTVLDQLVTDELLTSRLEDRGYEAWFAVRVVATPTEPRTLNFLPDVAEPPADLVEVAEDDLASYPTVVLVRDGSEPAQLHPGLPEELLLLWPLRSGADAVDEARLTLLGAEQYFSPMGNDLAWDVESPVATVRVPRAENLPQGLAEVAG